MSIEKKILHHVVTSGYDISERVYNLNEGWGIYESLGDNGWEYRIERNDIEEKFKDDGDAVRFVVGKALDGSPIHKEALSFMAKEGKESEIRFIVRSLSV